MATTKLEERRSALTARFPVWEPRTLSRFLADTAAEFAGRPLVLTDERTLTYREVDEWSTALADGLVSRGVRPGDHVGIVLANYPEFVPLKFAVARAGAVAVPLNFLYRRDELAYVLGQSRCRTLVTMTGFAGIDHVGLLDDIAPGWEQGPTDELPDLLDVILVPTTGTARAGVPTLDDLAAAGEAARGATAGRAARRPDEPADILYTSGTTGSPKGVVHTHDNVLRTAYASALTRAFQDRRRILFSLPCYHMFGYLEGLLAAMFVGGAVVLQPTFDPAAYLGGIERHRADDILCVPTMTVAILEHPDLDTADVSSLTAILSGAAPAPVWVWERVGDRLGITEITTGYGMTECGGAMTLTRPEDPLELHATTVGRIKLAGTAGLPNGDLCEYRTADPVSGEALPAGAEGELVSRGPTHLREFWGKPVETAAAVRDGWLHSGDVGRILDDGSLQVTGRTKELYKSGGELVMPKEVEELLTAHPGVSQAYVAGIPDERWGEIGCAWIVVEPGASIDADELLGLCREKLARFKVPKQIRVIDAADLPTTPTGKVQKFRLVARAVEEAAR
jgi:fatty-acyl-CoA synthase